MYGTDTYISNFFGIIIIILKLKDSVRQRLEVNEPCSVDGVHLCHIAKSKMMEQMVYTCFILLTIGFSE